MTQTVNDQNKPPQRRGRPGQRQQERLQRLARRRKRRVVLISSLVAALVVIGAGVAFWQYQRVNAEQAAAVQKVKDQHATATAKVTDATTTASNAAATVTALSTATVTAKATATGLANAMLTATSGSPTPAAGPEKPPTVTGKTVTLADGLKYIDIKVGPGKEAQAGSTVVVQYTGWLEADGKKFDSSYDRGGQPFEVKPLGQAQVISGWNEGLIGIKAGGTRRLFIPAALAYGAQGSPPTIPANANLIFDVTAVAVE